MRFGAHDVVEATGGMLLGPDATFTGVSYDTRTLQRGQLFVPLVAERDGHEFIPAALAAGAAGYLTTRHAQRGTAILVDDTLRALMDLATLMRTRFTGAVVGITGSVGKTSTKDLTRAALAASKRTWANDASLNNDFGLPTTLLNTPDEAEVMIVEMGMRGFGEIARLCRIAQPSIGIVTRVAEAHSERLGGIDGVARAKAELLESLPADGTAILNGDDARVSAMAAVTSAAVVRFGTQPSADVCIHGIRLDAAARPSFEVATPWGNASVRLGFSGAHMAMNAAAALACVGVVCGDLLAGAAALAELRPGNRRMNVVTTPSGGILIDDSYNANPTSMRAGLDALAEVPARRRVAVVGVMAEIDDPQAEHRAITAYAAERGIEVLPVGTDYYGINPVADPVAALGSLTDGVAVLVKGSLVAGLGVVAAALAQR